MASLLSWFGKEAKKVAHTVNNDVVKPVQRDVVAPVAHATTATVRAVQNAPQTINNDVVKPIPRVVLPTAKSLGIGLLKPGINSIQSGINVGKIGAGTITGNTVARNNAVKGLRNNAQVQVDTARQFFTRPVAEVAATVAHPLSQKTYRPGSRAEKLVFGQTPVQNVQKKVVNNYQTHKNLPSAARYGLAGLEAVGSIAQDAPVVGAVAKTAIKGGKAVAPELAKANQAVDKHLTPRVNRQDQATLQDFSDMHSGSYKAKPEARSQLIKQARDVGQKYGIDLRSGTPAQMVERANSVLDQIGKKNKQALEGGYIGSNDVPKIPVTQVTPLKEQPVIPKTGTQPLPQLPIKATQSQAVRMPSEVAPPPTSEVGQLAQPLQGDTRYASKTIPESQFVGENVSAETKANAPKYNKTSQKQQYTKSLSGVQQEGLEAFSARAADQLNVPSGKIGHQEVADAQTAAQLLENRNAPGDIQRAADLYDGVAGHLSAAGQTIQAAAVMARKSPAGLLYSAVRDLKRGGADITPEVLTKVKSLIDEYSATPLKSPQRDAALAKLSKVVIDAVPQGRVENIISVWKAGLLSGVKTHGGNILSNATFGALKKVSDLPSVAIDKSLSLVTGERTTAMTGRGIASGTAQGTKSGFQTFKTGIDLRNAGDKYEQHAGINFKSKVAQKVIGNPANKVFNLLGAADQPFYYASLKNSLYDQAKALGINKGLRGRALNDFMAKTVKEPSETMMQRAVNDANKSVLGYDTFASKAVQGMHKGIDSLDGVSEAGKKTAHAVINILAPFVRVPSAFISRTVDFTPLGVGKTIFSQIAHKKFDQRALSQAIGEGLTGTGAVAIGIALTQHKLISGDYPKDDPKEAQRWKAEGITPNSVKIGNTWISLNYLGPLGLLFNAGHNMESANGEGAVTKAGAAVGGLGQGLLGQSFLQGFSGFSDAIQDPSRNLKSFVNSQASSIVPNISNDVATTTDSFQRQADTAIQAGKNRIPGLRETNKKKQDVYGNDLKKQTSGLNTINPLKPSDNISNLVISEVNRLHNVDLKNNDLQVTPTQLDKSIKVEGKDVKLSDQQRYDLQKKVGQATQDAWGKLIKTPEYKALSDIDKAKALSNLRTDTSTLTQRQYVTSTNLGTYAKSASRRVQALSAGDTSLTSYTSGANTGGSKIDINPSIDAHSQKVLNEYNTLPADKKKSKSYAEPSYDYKVAQAKYDNDKAEGKLSAAQDIKRSNSLERLKVAQGIPKDVRELYGLSKDDANAYLSTSENGKDKKKMSDQLLAYDKALYNAGLISKLKYKTGIASKKKGGRKSGGSKGSSEDKTSLTKLASLLSSTNNALKPPTPPKSPHITVKTAKLPGSYKQTALKKYTVARTKIA